MAKREKKNRKLLREAAELRTLRRKQLFKLLGALILAVALWGIWAAWNTFVPHENTMISSVMIFLTAVIVCILVGEVGVKWSKYDTEYRKYKNEYGFTDEDVKEQMRIDAK